MLQDDHRFGLRFPKPLHGDLLEDITREDGTVAHDLVAPSTVEDAPIRDPIRAGVLKIVRHAQRSFGRSDSCPSAARKTSKSDRYRSCHCGSQEMRICSESVWPLA
jgi:hypothetical protein